MYTHAHSQLPGDWGLIEKQTSHSPNVITVLIITFGLVHLGQLGV